LWKNSNAGMLEAGRTPLAPASGLSALQISLGRQQSLPVDSFARPA
jgi:hypothetical protein